jgi:hypothetical protein
MIHITRRSADNELVAAQHRIIFKSRTVVDRGGEGWV